MIPEEIPRDLQNGMGLEESLIKHKTNLKVLFKKKPSPFEGMSQYIERRGKH